MDRNQYEQLLKEHLIGTSPYTAAIGALRVLSKSAAVDYGKGKIRVNSFYPGIVVTPMTVLTMKDVLPYYKNIHSFHTSVNQKILPMDS
jgi:NAD(P)-dependent dehydrogenase (short-subunit alcohol dehydrogenase family)